MTDEAREEAIFRERDRKRLNAQSRRDRLKFAANFPPHLPDDLDELLTKTFLEQVEHLKSPACCSVCSQLVSSESFNACFSFVYHDHFDSNICMYTVEQYEIEDIPNILVLRTSKCEPWLSVVVINNESYILDPAGVNGTILSICQECFSELSARRLPSIALRNDLCIGSVPDVLQNLTIPESMLLAKVFTVLKIVDECR
jgi:hypothetical protein